MFEGPIRTAEPRDGALTWLDEGPIEAEWAPPQPTVPEPRPARIPAVALYGIVLLALVLVVTGIWTLGGLKKRTDVLIPATPGELIATGPYELSFTEVTAQRTTSYDKSVYWKLTMIGSGRTTGPITIAPSWSGDYGMFVSRDDATQEIEGASGTDFGEKGSSTAAFTPGLPPIRYAVEFKYRDTYRPGPTLRVLVFDLRFYDNSLLGDGDPAWHNTQYAHQLLLPVRVLPDATS